MIGVLADVHGNLAALRAAVAELERRGAERWIVAGDLVGYGPQPNECVELVAGLGAVCVVGNHDLMALGALSDERCIPLAREVMRWTRTVLGADAREYLEALPLVAREGDIVVAHGTLDDPQTYTHTRAHAREQLARLAPEDARAVAPATGGPALAPRVLVLGHTHRPLAVAERSDLRPSARVALPRGERVVLNPGAVGQARELRARARALALDAGEAAFLRLSYDIAATRGALAAAGLPRDACHLPPSPRRKAVRLAGAARRRVRRKQAA
jgi:predicted phosphodiesterase